ncbi:hypothetical protein IDH44_17290 [Paenibacillus sp. IB182496]|uniref:Uncharacterized protein n=1 Tax=Paenibacillus sabuli TaxID=2772509 RepID=A0A927BWJ9_9BACL|nr:hypothetical protein [Paenibacillus sabuli]MBD2846955.1 hypothetical protein [Paenibacillus sabuli]
MEARKQEVVRRIEEAGLLKDPQWLSRLDEPAPLWVVLETLLRMIDRIDPPGRPYD